jgi:hypothetical protein
VRCEGAVLSILVLSLLLSSGSALGRSNAGVSDTVSFTCRELLGRPTDRSIALNVCTNADAEVFVEFGVQTQTYGSQTPVTMLYAGVPGTLTLSSLLPDRRYFYRVRYRAVGTAEFGALGEHSFQTARSRGYQCTFAIEADPHVDSATSPTLYQRTLTNIRESNPDFMIDLGDTFMSDKLPVKNPQEILARHLLLRSFYDTLGGSVPLLLVLGNHEGELGWLLNGTADNVAVWASQIRKQYYPNPVPDGFYTGDTTRQNFVDLRQNYYAWEWGNALFVVLDPYWYTNRKPTSSKNGWDWTLGQSQYDWFKRTLETSDAKFKFVFAHQVVGGLGYEGRGGIEGVPFYEMGGFNSDSTWGFTVNRPSWPAPLHQLMTANHVTAFFHGHDHVFVRQELDGIVYQELPQPGYYNLSNPEKSYSNTDLAAKYGYVHGVVISSSGYLRVTVADTIATVEYVRSYLPEHENSQRRNGDVAYTYTLKPSAPATGVMDAEAIPLRVSLEQNFPNPFNPTTVISFQSPVAGNIRIAVYDILGREVALLVNEEKEPGIYRVDWDASRFPSGMYFYRMTTGSFCETRRMVLVR